METKLEELRQAHQRLQRMFFVVSVLALIVLSAGFTATDRPPRNIEVESLSLVDSEGTQRAVLSAKGGSARLSFFRADGKPAVLVGVQANESSLVLKSAKGAENTVTGTGVAIQSAEGSIGMDIDSGRGPTISLSDSAGPRIGLGVANRQSSLQLFASGGSSRIRLLVDAAGLPQLALMSAKNAVSLGLSVDDKGKAVISQ